MQTIMPIFSIEGLFLTTIMHEKTEQTFYDLIVQNQFSKNPIHFSN